MGPKSRTLLLATGIALVTSWKASEGRLMSTAQLAPTRSASTLTELAGRNSGRLPSAVSTLSRHRSAYSANPGPQCVEVPV